MVELEIYQYGDWVWLNWNLNHFIDYACNFYAFDIDIGGDFFPVNMMNSAETANSLPNFSRVFLCMSVNEMNWVFFWIIRVWKKTVLILFLKDIMFISRSTIIDWLVMFIETYTKSIHILKVRKTYFDGSSLMYDCMFYVLKIEGYSFCLSFL